MIYKVLINMLNFCYGILSDYCEELCFSFLFVATCQHMQPTFPLDQFEFPLDCIILMVFSI